jgi:hypothetical protein
VTAIGAMVVCGKDGPYSIQDAIAALDVFDRPALTWVDAITLYPGCTAVEVSAHDGFGPAVVITEFGREAVMNVDMSAIMDMVSLLGFDRSFNRPGNRGVIDLISPLSAHGAYIHDALASV